MGGTSTDVALIDGDITLTTEGRIADYPVAIPMVDMHTIGGGEAPSPRWTLAVCCKWVRNPPAPIRGPRVTAGAGGRPR